MEAFFPLLNELTEFVRFLGLYPMTAVETMVLASLGSTQIYKKALSVEHDSLAFTVNKQCWYCLDKSRGKVFIALHDAREKLKVRVGHEALDLKGGSRHVILLCREQQGGKQGGG